MTLYALGFASGVISTLVVVAILVAKGAKDLNYRGEDAHSYDPGPGINPREVPSQKPSDVLPKGDRNAPR